MERAAWLCGAAAALREDMGWPLSPAERAEHERIVTGTLGEEAFAAAGARGYGLPLREAIPDLLEQE